MVVGVRGPPQVVSQSGQVVGIDGSDVRLEAEFCSDPSPSRSAWSWGGVVVESGEEEGQGGRFRADLVTSSPHCYLSRLTVRGVGQEDSRQYTVTVTNIHGNDTQPVRLTVRGRQSSSAQAHHHQLDHFSPDAAELRHHCGQPAGSQSHHAGLHLPPLQEQGQTMLQR